MNPKKWLTYGIMLALVAWGVYLAIGATGMFVQEDMMDARKSGIVMVCVALFLGLWGIVIAGSKNKAKINSNAAPIESGSGTRLGTTRAWSRPGLATLGLAIAGAALWGFAIWVWESAKLREGVEPNHVAITVLGWLTALCVLASASSGMIALSSKQANRGKWFGLLGLIGFVVALVAFVSRMTP